MVDIEGSLNDLQAVIDSSALMMRPSIFPSYLKLSSIDDLCLNEKHRAELNLWLQSNDVEKGNITFTTRVDYATRRITIEEIKVL
jgi:hypothetical protein